MPQLHIYNGRWKSDLVMGVLIGLAFIFLSVLIPSITIGFPTLPQATEGERLVVVGFLAPAGEELMFRGLAMFVFDTVAPVWVAVPAQAVVFGLFHAKAYGASYALQNLSAVSGAIFGAILFGLVAGVVTVWKKSLIPAVIMHASFNIYLVSKYLVVVSL